MQVTAGSSYLSPTPAIRPASRAAARPEVADAVVPAPGKPALVSDGLVNWSSLITPETLAAMFALDPDGAVKTDATGQPQMSASHQGPWVGDEQLIVMRVRGQAMEKLGVNANLASHVTDEQKQFFHAVTGHNLVTEGDTSMVIDDDGNLVPDTTGPEGGLCGAVQQFAGSLMIGGPGGGDTLATSPDGFAAWSAQMAAGGVAIPPEWAARARAFFDHAMDALFDKQPETAGTAPPTPAAASAEANAAYARTAAAAA